MDNYDRMNPDFYQLLERLDKYAERDYGMDAYPLSSAEARLLLDLIFEPNTVQIGVSE